MIRCLCALALCAPCATADEPDLEPVKRWLSHQADVKSVRADFQQERQLRTLKRPIITPGKLWFRAPGSFRWELGVPPRTIALQRPDQDMLVLQPLQGRALRYSKEKLAEPGGARGVGFLSAGFPRSFDSFTEQFTVTEVTLAGGEYQFEARLNDTRASLVLRKIIFYVAADTFQTKGFYLRFRDSSSIATRFENVKEGATVEDSVFEEALEDYEIEQQR